MTILIVLTYLIFIIFIVKILSQGIRIAKAPVHLRWELYPVPHEKGRSHYGGSRLEEVDWWEKKQHKDHLGELKVMLPEIIFLKGVWEHNKSLWFGSFTFHFGLYLLIINMFVLIFAAIYTLAGGSASADSGIFGQLIYYAIFWLAVSGSAIGIIGALRLFLQRIADLGLRLYSTPSHYFNILLIGGLYVTLLIWALSDGLFVNSIIGYYQSLFTFGGTTELSSAGYVHIGLSLFFILYLPFTHMTHFFTKYFTYHKVRWEDEANQPGSKIAVKVSGYLNQTVTWAAPHIGADGSKNWIAIASSLPNTEEKNEK